MNRNDAEDLARAYCLRNVESTRRHAMLTRPAAEAYVLELAVEHYGSGLTAAALTRIRRALRNNRPPKGLQAMLRLDQ